MEKQNSGKMKISIIAAEPHQPFSFSFQEKEKR